MCVDWNRLALPSHMEHMTTTCPLDGSWLPLPVNTERMSDTFALTKKQLPKFMKATSGAQRQCGIAGNFVAPQLASNLLKLACAYVGNTLQLACMCTISGAPSRFPFTSLHI